MKTFLHKKRTNAIIIASIISLNLLAQGSGVFTKEIKKDFTVAQQTRVEISNKYGNVDITNRDDGMLSIKVQIKVNGRDQQRADEMLKMININISQEGNLIKAVTDIEDDFSKFFKGFNTGNGGLEINYSVSMPKTLPLNLLNKYGSVFIDELTATSVIEVKYGKLTVNKIIHDSKEPLTKVYLSYSNGTIQEAKWIELDMKYSKINITESKALAIISKYSKVFITNGSSVVSESKYDTYEIGKLTNFLTTASYGHFTINDLAGKLQVDTKYSDILVDNIASGFEEIKVTNSYGSYKLGIDPAASYRLNGYSKYCNIVYPENNAKVSRFNENNEMKVNGVIGNNQNPKAEVSITSHYGNVRLVQ
jgi:hypothetical protein